MLSGALVWGGLAVALVGVALLGRCILTVRQIRGQDLPKAEFDARLRRMIALNAVAVGTGFFGIALMILGAVL